MKKIIVGILVVLVIVLAGAGGYWVLNKNKKTPPVTAPTTSKNVGATLSDSNDFYSINVSYPSEPKDKEGIMKQFAEGLFNRTKEEWKIGGSVYQEEQDLAEQFPDRPKVKYERMMSFERYETGNSKMVSYVFDDYQFTGGAHGNNIIYTFSFDDKGQIKIDDLLNFDGGRDIKLSKALAQKVLDNADLKDSTDKEMVYHGLGLDCLDANDVFNGKLCLVDGFFYPSNFQSFVLSDNGITFIMQKYQVAAGVAGNPKIFFSWDELAPYLKK